MTGDTTLRTGTRVVVRGDHWTVIGQTPFDGCTSLRLQGCGAGNAGMVRTLLVPFDRVRPAAILPGMQVVRARRWLHEVRRVAAATHPFGGLTTAARSRIDLLPYQLEPALAVAHGATRLMIADAVGLGKTVQAGLILSELAEDSEYFRALIATPAGLRDQWLSELTGHFSLSPVVADAAWLGRMGRELPPDINPWVVPGVYIASFDFLKRPEVLRPLEDVTWDAVVVDEAHNVSTGTARRAAINAIAIRSRRVVLLTATPHAGDEQQFDDSLRPRRCRRGPRASAHVQAFATGRRRRAPAPERAVARPSLRRGAPHAPAARRLHHAHLP